MTLNTRIAILAVAIILAIVISIILRKDKIPVRYSILWWFVVVILLLLSIFPNMFLFFTKLVGFQTTSNVVIGIFFVILLFITISLTVIVSTQNKKITLLIQELSMLKGKNNEK